VPSSVWVGKNSKLKVVMLTSYSAAFAVCFAMTQEGPEPLSLLLPL